jgi:hypothetical protein
MCELELLKPTEVDRLLRYPRGRSKRLALAGKLPHIALPDGEIRFVEAEIEKLLTAGTTTSGPTPVQEESCAS